MKLVAAHAGLGKGTVYHYFPSKADLLRELFNTSLDKARGRLNALLGVGGGPLEQLRGFCRGQLLTLIREPHLFRFFKRVFEEAELIFGDQAQEVIGGYRDAIQAPVNRLFREAAGQGEIVEMMEGDSLKLFWGAMIGAVTVYFEGHDVADAEAVADRALDLLFDGILVRPDRPEDQR